MSWVGCSQVFGNQCCQKIIKHVCRFVLVWNMVFYNKIILVNLNHCSNLFMLVNFRFYNIIMLINLKLSNRMVTLIRYKYYNRMFILVNFNHCHRMFIQAQFQEYFDTHATQECSASENLYPRQLQAQTVMLKPFRECTLMLSKIYFCNLCRYQTEIVGVVWLLHFATSTHRLSFLSTTTPYFASFFLCYLSNAFWGSNLH